MSGPVKRRYRSTRRAAAAIQTRTRIRDAAARLFVDRGYVATTMRDVATTAKVGERTLYDAFPNKAALFGEVLAVATVGDDQPVPVADRPEIKAALEEPDPAVAIARLVRYTTELLDRAGDLIMVSVEAAGSDPDMRAAADAGAADIPYAATSPHLHQLLRRHRGWRVEAYRAWLEDTLIDQLLG